MFKPVGAGSIINTIIPGVKAAQNPIREQLAYLINKEQLYAAADYEATNSRAISFDNRLYLIREHHTALVHWARALLEKRINYDSLLLHADLHPDTGLSVARADREIYGADGYPINRDRTLLEAERLTKLNDSYADLTPEENFIRLAIDLKIIGEYVHLIPGAENDFAPEKLPIASRTLTLDACLNTLPVNPARTVVFDLDLDFFSDLKEMPYRRTEGRDRELAKLLLIMQRFNPGVVTVAFSLRSTSMIKTYLTLEPEECVAIIAEIIQGMNLRTGQESYYAEPRRSMRFSPR